MDIHGSVVLVSLVMERSLKFIAFVLLFVMSPIVVAVDSQCLSQIANGLSTTTYCTILSEDVLFTVPMIGLLAYLTAKSAR